MGASGYDEDAVDNSKASRKHAAVADRKRGMLIVRARASKAEMYPDNFQTKRRMEDIKYDMDEE